MLPTPYVSDDEVAIYSDLSMYTPCAMNIRMYILSDEIVFPIYIQWMSTLLGEWVEGRGRGINPN